MSLLNTASPWKGCNTQKRTPSIGKRRTQRSQQPLPEESASSLAADLEEQVVTETNSASGGKGGGGSVTSTTRSYIYFASFAVGLCAGAISSVDRVWANGKLVHDASSSLLDMTVYLGNETQVPDDRIESALGVGFVPAYRGMSYAVINRLNLSEYGNQIPNLQFEVTA